MPHTSLGIAYLNGARLQRSLLAAADWVDAGREELNRINVFPVPDGDTGTNFAMTLRAVAEAVRGLDRPTLPQVTSAMATACIFNARGNSGMLLSQFLLGFRDSIGDSESATASDVAIALRTGAERLYESLEEPVEGTILTVCRETADIAVTIAEKTPDFEEFMRRVLQGANEVLARTPELLVALRESGVVDAGGQGFVRLLEGIVMLIDGDPIEAGEPMEFDTPSAAALADVAEDRDYGFCTEVLVRGDSLPSASEVRAELRPLGGSLVVMADRDLLKVHIHLDDPESLFSRAARWGTIESSKADDMREQHSDLGDHSTRRELAIVLDSSCDLPDEVLDREHMILVPLQVTQGDRTMLDRVDPETRRIYEEMRAGKTYTTSQPTPGAFAQVFRDAAKEADAVLGIILASALSGTFGAAQAATRAAGLENVTLFDSRSASLGLGLLAVRAQELHREGRSVQEIVAELTAVRDRSSAFFTVDVFDNLLKSGRVGRGRAWLGSLLDIKPILEISREGRAVPLDRVRGRAHVVARVLDHLEKRLTPRPRRLRMGLVHADAQEVLDEMLPELERRFEPIEILTGPVTPAIGVHVGPGAWGVFYQVEEPA